MPVSQRSQCRVIAAGAGEKFNSLLRSSYSARDRVGIGNAIIAHPTERRSHLREAPSLPTSVADPMKNAFVLSTLILPAGYSVAQAAEMIGAASIHLPSFSSFIGLYVAAGVLTLAFADYFRPTSARSSHARRPATRREPALALHVLSLTNPPLRTN